MKWCLIHVYPFKYLYGRKKNAFCDYEHCKELYTSFTEMHKDTQGVHLLLSVFVPPAPSSLYLWIPTLLYWNSCYVPCTVFHIGLLISFQPNIYFCLSWDEVHFFSQAFFFFRLCLKFWKLRTLILESSFHSDGRVVHTKQKTPVLFILIEGQDFITSHGCSFVKMGVILQPFCIFSKGQRKNKWT